MTRFGRIAIGATLLVAATAALQPAMAACVSPRIITTGESYIYTPGYESGGGFMDSTVSPDFVGAFWGVGSGDLGATGTGIDNGSFPAFGGWMGIYPGYPAIINSTWAASTSIDGCIDFAAAPRCMAILLMDNDANSGTGAFALLTDLPDNLINYDFEQLGKGPINLVAIPSLSITASVRTGSCSITTAQACSVVADCPSGETCVDGTGVDISVDGIQLSAISAGLYLDPDCPQPTGAGGMIQGYQIYAREVPRGAPPPTDTNEENWTPVGPVTPLGEPGAASLSCTGDTDQYLTAGLVFDSASLTRYLSGSTTRFECGANLADPADVIQRKPRNREAPRSRTKR